MVSIRLEGSGRVISKELTKVVQPTGSQARRKAERSVGPGLSLLPNWPVQGGPATGAERHRQSRPTEGLYKQKQLKQT